MSRTASMCGPCGELRRQPYVGAAHDALRDEATEERPQGLIQLFACAACGTRWERFRRKRDTSASAVWRTH